MLLNLVPSFPWPLEKLQPCTPSSEICSGPMEKIQTVNKRPFNCSRWNQCPKNQFLQCNFQASLGQFAGFEALIWLMAWILFNSISTLRQEGPKHQQRFWVWDGSARRERLLKKPFSGQLPAQVFHPCIEVTSKIIQYVVYLGQALTHHRFAPA